MKIFNTPWRVQNSFVSPLYGVTSQPICQVQNYTSDILNSTCPFSSIEWQVSDIAPIANQFLSSSKLHIWHSKFHLWILINRMTSPQNCSYRKLISVKFILHLWQITVKFSTTPLTVIKLLSSSILNLWKVLFLKLPYRSWDERC